MDKILEEMILYIEEKEEAIEAEYCYCKDAGTELKDNMPELYHKIKRMQEY